MSSCVDKERDRLREILTDRDRECETERGGRERGDRQTDDSVQQSQKTTPKQKHEPLFQILKVFTVLRTDEDTRKN